MAKQVLMNVVLDRCPTCQGVWLDGGELELIKRTMESNSEEEWFEGFLTGMASGSASK
jgi:Zn-finger nucleic acid-binding protein